MPPTESTPIKIETHILSDVDITVYTKAETLEEMDLEEYIVGVVAGEMPASYEQEALKAQAVAARTYALRKMLNGGCSKHEGADICAFSEHCQAYCTLEEMQKKWGDSFEAYYNKIKDAVYATAGIVMTYENDVINALFFAESDGRTEDCINVFSDSLPYLVGVDSPEDAEPAFKTISFQEFADLATAAYPNCSITAGNVSSSVEVLSRYKSGQVEALRLGNEIITGKQARTAFSLRSANFSVTFGDKGVTFSVLGYGHGVGMSQKGADVMAENGSTYAEILSHYYTSVNFENAAKVLARG